MLWRTLQRAASRLFSTPLQRASHAQASTRVSRRHAEARAYDHCVRDAEELSRIHRYIQNHPVKADNRFNGRRISMVDNRRREESRRGTL